MKTPQQWMDHHGYDENVCCGHGEYYTLPKRLTPELVAAIQADARESERLAQERKQRPYRGDYY